MAFTDRIASAPISWGICEVPGWGHMLPTDRVLSEMTDLGIQHVLQVLDESRKEDEGR